MAIIKKIGSSYQARIRKAGFPNRSKNFPTKDQAKDWAAEVEKEMKKHDYQDPKVLSTTYVAGLIDRYNEAHSDPEKPLGKNKVNTLRRLHRMLGEVKVAEISAKTLTAFIEDRKKNGNGGKGAGGVAISSDIGVLKVVLKYAKTVWHLPVNLEPFVGITATMELMGLHTKSEERSRRPTDDELSRLKTYFKTKKRQTIPMHDIIDFAVATAMRAAEITRIKWQDLNEADRTVIIRARKDPKHKETNDQVVPLLVDAWETIQAQPKKSDFIFPFNERTFSTIFPRACQALKIEDLTFHDLRHEGTSRLFENGYQIQEVAVFTGHRDWKSLKRYVQLKAKDLHYDQSGNLRRRPVTLPLEANFV